MIELLPQFNRRQITTRAYRLGVRVDFNWQKTLAAAKRDVPAAARKETPAKRLDSQKIFPDERERLAYTRAWR